MRIVRNIVFVIALLMIGYDAIVQYYSSQRRAILQENSKIMRSVEFECPERMQAKIELWGKMGYSRTCVNLRHGKWEAWEAGFKQIDGYYDHGKAHGTWVFYNSDGSVSKEIEYNQGVEIARSSTVKEGD